MSRKINKLVKDIMKQASWPPIL